MANQETDLQQRIRLALGTHPNARVFRNQVGSLPDPRTGRLAVSYTHLTLPTKRIV